MKLNRKKGALKMREGRGASHIAANIIHLLDSRNMPARELARRVGVTPQAVSLWCRDETIPSMRRLIQIAEQFQVSVERLNQDTGDESVVSLRQLELSLVNGPSGQPVLDEKLAKQGLWQTPRELIEAQDPRSDVAVLNVRDSEMEPELRVGDLVFADLACRTVVASGIYLLVVAASPAWKRCYPLLSDKVLVTDRTVKQEVAASDLRVLARAIRLLTKP